MKETKERNKRNERNKVRKDKEKKHTGPDSVEAAAKAAHIFKFVRSDITTSIFPSNTTIIYNIYYPFCIKK